MATKRVRFAEQLLLRRIQTAEILPDVFYDTEEGVYTGTPGTNTIPVDVHGRPVEEVGTDETAGEEGAPRVSVRVCVSGVESGRRTADE